MKIPNRIIASLQRNTEHLPLRTLAHRRLDFIPNRKSDVSAGPLARRSAFLSRGGAQASRVEFERLMGANDLVDEFYLERALLSAMPVCRLGVRSASGHERGCATGFMVSPRLLLTNAHVLGSAEEAEPSVAEFNYRLDIAGRPEPSFRFRLRPDLYFVNDDGIDAAIVAVEPQSLDDSVPLSTFGYHRLIPETGKVKLKEWMTIIQHPGGARRQFAIRENQCINDQDPNLLWYMSDTAQGSSGSPVFNDSLQVVALHHAGQARRDSQKNYILKDGSKVKDLRNVDDSQVDWIANAGIRISRICDFIATRAPEKNGALAELKTAMQSGDVLTTAYASGTPNIGGDMNPRITVGTGSGGNRLVLGTLVLELNGVMVAELPSQVKVIPGVSTTSDASSDSVESYKEPIVDTNYASRTGFNRKFLGVSTPLPTVTAPSVIAPMLSGGKFIPYDHFSVVLHKQRRLAIFTAANVDGSAKAKHPEAGRSYTRAALTGLKDGELEKWVLDPRVDAKFQIPDSFYTKDNGAFDKGHITRREDVCFGQDFAEVQRANGDTFHVTNCSPQRGNFNQSRQQGIWGQLENFIGAQADSERFCIFAGPVLADTDQTFVGGPASTQDMKVQIPSRFWKVVCAVKAKKLQVFAFVLEQDIKDLPLEFQVTAEWKHRQVSLEALEGIVKLVKFQKSYHDADQA